MSRESSDYSRLATEYRVLLKKECRKTTVPAETATEPVPVGGYSSLVDVHSGLALYVHVIRVPEHCLSASQIKHIIIIMLFGFCITFPTMRLCDLQSSKTTSLIAIELNKN